MQMDVLPGNRYPISGNFFSPYYKKGFFNLSSYFLAISLIAHQLSVEYPDFVCRFIFSTITVVGNALIKAV